MSIQKRIKKREQRRAFRVRNKLRTINRSGKARISVFRSNRSLYVQIIDDMTHNTIVGLSTFAVSKTGGKNKELAHKLGLLAGQKALERSVESVYFDRGSYLYHGRIKALADGLREAGLQF